MDSAGSLEEDTKWQGPVEHPDDVKLGIVLQIPHPRASVCIIGI